MTTPGTVNGAVPLERLEVGVVLERRPLASRWQDHVWRVAEVIAGGLEATPGTLVEDEASGVARYHAGTLPVELYRKDTEGYRRNLSEPIPQVFVVLRPRGDGGDGPPLRPFRATVCPYEAEAYGISDDDIVENRPMPAALVAAVAAFIERHHVDEPFIKRRQKPKTQPHEPFARRSDPRVRT